MTPNGVYFCVSPGVISVPAQGFRWEWQCLMGGMAKASPMRCGRQCVTESCPHQVYLLQVIA